MRELLLREQTIGGKGDGGERTKQKGDREMEREGGGYPGR